MSPRVKLFNVKYSPNLGDGLLSECLERALVEHGADPASCSTDLSARTAYERGTVGRSRLLHGLTALPQPIRGIAVRAPLELMLRRRWLPHYRETLGGADAVVVGGGNLLTDMDLNFPLKVSAALEEAARRRLPSAIFGVGVGEPWSSAGLAMMRRALLAAAPRDVSVRDAASKARWDRLFADAAGREARIVRDPGFLVSRYVPARPRDGTIGVCVTSGIALRYHSDVAVGDDELVAWYAELVARLSERAPVVVFTNGSPEDERFLDEAHDLLVDAAQGAAVRAEVATPDELATLVSGFAALVAHRMHALIAAASYGVPIWALAWDGKVAAMMDSIGAADRVGRAEPGTAPAIAAAVLALANEPHAPPAAVLREAFDSVGTLAEALWGGVPLSAVA